MATRTKTRKSTTPPAKPHDLLEEVVKGGGASPLVVDRAAGVIRRVKVLGRFSKNRHGVAEAANGCEYTRGCMESALPMYEGLKVKIDHPEKRSEPGAERSVRVNFGVLRNAVVEPDDAGDPAVWADLHYLRSHDMAESVCEDVERGLGVYGLSHNAAAEQERFDPAARRLVIQRLALVRSADLVDRPATNRNLWESEEPTTMTHTLKTILTSRMAALSKPRRGWARQLLEDDMGAPMDAPAELDAAPEADPDAALKGGFDAACSAVLSSDMTADEKIAKLRSLLKTHEKLTQEAEPEEVEEAEEEDEKPKPKDKAESEELARLRAESAARDLCESLDFSPTKVQVRAVAGLSADKDRRELVESFKGRGGAGGGFRPPRSRSPIPAPKDKAGDKLESGTVDAAAGLRVLMG